MANKWYKLPLLLNSALYPKILWILAQKGASAPLAHLGYAYVHSTIFSLHTSAIDSHISSPKFIVMFCHISGVKFWFGNLLIISVVTDSEFASKSANFFPVRPSPSPRIFSGRKWRFWNVCSKKIFTSYLKFIPPKPATDAIFTYP